MSESKLPDTSDYSRSELLEDLYRQALTINKWAFGQPAHEEALREAMLDIIFLMKKIVEGEQ